MKFITLTDIIKGIVFSIGLIIVGFLLLLLFAYTAEALFDKASSLTLIIGFVVFMIFLGIITVFSKAVQSGFSIRSFFSFEDKDKKEG
jgi:uncharacterized membrane protein YbhN (UPF0104 family)